MFTLGRHSYAASTMKVEKKKIVKREESCRPHRLHAGHPTYVLRDEAPVHFQYATLPMWLSNRYHTHHSVLCILHRWY